MGRDHIECINCLDGAEVIAGADTLEENRKKFEEKAVDSATRCFSDYRELLELDEVAAVVIATPDHLHVDMVSDAIAADKHVLSEKPAATSYEALARLERKVAKSKKVYQVGLDCRYLPSFRKAEKMIRENSIGAPRML